MAIICNTIIMMMMAVGCSFFSLLRLSRVSLLQTQSGVVITKKLKYMLMAEPFLYWRDPPDVAVVDKKLLSFDRLRNSEPGFV